MSLLMAIKCGRIHQARLLLDIRTNPNIPDKDLKTPLMHACFIEKQNMAAKIARMLIDKGAVISTKDKYKRTALSYACMNGKETIVEMLLGDVDYDINEQDYEGNSSLMYAAMSGNAKALRYVLQMLMKYRLSVDLRNKKGFSAYLLAAKMGRFYCAHILKSEGFASDGIRDTEYFLSDKEWVKKVHKDIARIQLNGNNIRIMGSRSACVRRPRISLTTRPKTSVDFLERAESPSRDAHDLSHRCDPRAGSRFTSRSELPRLLENSWINQDITVSSLCMSSVTSTNSENTLRLISDSSGVTEAVPSEARTKTPDLHAIFCRYLDKEVYKPVRVIPNKEIVKNVQFCEAENKTAPTRKSRPSLSKRKQSRQSLKLKSGV